MILVLIRLITNNITIPLSLILTLERYDLFLFLGCIKIWFKLQTKQIRHWRSLFLLFYYSLLVILFIYILNVIQHTQSLSHLPKNSHGRTQGSSYIHSRTVLKWCVFSFVHWDIHLEQKTYMWIFQLLRLICSDEFGWGWRVSS